MFNFCTKLFVVLKTILCCKIPVDPKSLVTSTLQVNCIYELTDIRKYRLAHECMFQNLLISTCSYIFNLVTVKHGLHFLLFH